MAQCGIFVSRLHRYACRWHKLHVFISQHEVNHSFNRVNQLIIHPIDSFKNIGSYNKISDCTIEPIIINDSVYTDPNSKLMLRAIADVLQARVL